MPVTIYPVTHGANAFPAPPDKTATRICKESCANEYRKVKDDHLIQSSFSHSSNSNICASDNGFVDAILQSHDQHRHLRLRPDDVWLTILLQLNIYVNEHAEELRHIFVEHVGQQELIIDVADFAKKGSGLDWGLFSYLMTKQMQSNIKDPSLREWILPTFTTTTKKDQTVASIVMMSILQKYFVYGADEVCGIPSVTLLGEKSDWEDILQRVDRLAEFGNEPREYGELLTPVLKRFVRCFDDPDSQELQEFWRKVVNHDDTICGRDDTTGWLNAFIYWDGDGKPYRKGLIPESFEYQLDGIYYHPIDLQEYPSGHVSVPVVLYNFSIKRAIMVAGCVGMQCFDSTVAETHGMLKGRSKCLPHTTQASQIEKRDLPANSSERTIHPYNPPLDCRAQRPSISKSGGTNHSGESDYTSKCDTLQPECGWWMFASKSEDELKDLPPFDRTWYAYR